MVHHAHIIRSNIEYIVTATAVRDAVTTLGDGNVFSGFSLIKCRCLFNATVVIELEYNNRLSAILAIKI